MSSDLVKSIKLSASVAKDIKYAGLAQALRGYAEDVEVLEAALADKTRELEVAKKGILANEKKLIVRITYSKDDSAFISAVYGQVTIDVLEEIEESYQEDLEEVFNLGDGDYLFSVSYYEAQIDGHGRIELSAYYELKIIEYKPFEEEATEPKAEPATNGAGGEL